MHMNVSLTRLRLAARARLGVGDLLVRLGGIARLRGVGRGQAYEALHMVL